MRRLAVTCTPRAASVPAPSTGRGKKHLIALGMDRSEARQKHGAPDRVPGECYLATGYVLALTWDVPHAVIRVSENHREQLERDGKIPIRLQFVELARRCQGWRVVLYQSARQAGRPSEAVGYFATAVVTAVLVLEGRDVQAELLVADLGPLEDPQPMFVQGGFREPSLRTSSGQFDGWLAAEDVREITPEQFRELAGGDEQAPFAGSPDAPLPVPRFQTHRRQIRDRRLRGLVYQAYGGKCAISGVSLLYPNGRCGLVAAHIFPYAIEPHNSVRDAILMAPNWHSRFDDGGIIIHDDYSWAAIVEDSETSAIRDRRLHLPILKTERPDRGLLARKRALFIK